MCASYSISATVEVPVVVAWEYWSNTAHRRSWLDSQTYSMLETKAHSDFLKKLSYKLTVQEILDIGFTGSNENTIVTETLNCENDCITTMQCSALRNALDRFKTYAEETYKCS